VARGFLGALVKLTTLRATRAVVFGPEQALTFLRLSRDHPLEGVFRLGMALGLRMGEATGVMWSDVDATTNVLTLRRQVVPDVQADGGRRPQIEIVQEHAAAARCARQRAPTPSPARLEHAARQGEHGVRS
jgi:hypothetical protein